ncbi:MAG: hypothetical protein WDO18_09475 [Acidobacteriota bacterium]
MTRREAFRELAVCTIASKGFTPGTANNSTCLPSFSASSTTWLKSSFSYSLKSWASVRSNSPAPAVMGRTVMTTMS